MPTPWPTRRTPDLTFGIYPGGVAGFFGLAGAPPDDPVQIQNALNALQPSDTKFLVRGWIAKDSATDPNYPVGNDDWMNLRQYAVDGRKLNLVVAYTTLYGSLQGWVDYVRAVVRQYGPWLDSLSVTSEANAPYGNPPDTDAALVDGVIAANDEARRDGYPHMSVGFDVRTSPTESDGTFWTQLLALGGRAFVRSVDYVGAVVYPDVYSPAAPDGQPEDIPYYLAYFVGAATRLPDAAERTGPLGTNSCGRERMAHRASNRHGSGTDRNATSPSR